MSLEPLAAALLRARTVLTRRPDMGLHQDSAATVRWQGGTRNVVSHDNGTRLETDMSTELGGSGDRVTPGWLFRAGVASCAVTTIAMRAAMEGVELTTLEARVESRSDTRGLLGMATTDGTPIEAAPRAMRLHVRIAASGATEAALRGLVDRACGCSPVPRALTGQTALDVAVELA